ncbi:hypothetical protein [Devosia sp.]|uniref:hypothetical protein n=1 Tax=Devosia sp. TaxID=1871048 RepID=UPI002624E415|nr:hypothetical protein [Devosia sp.]
MRKLIGASLAGLMLVSPALADGKVYVQLPDLSSLHGEGQKDFLRGLILANVISSNCPDFAVTEPEWSLLTDSADLIGRGQFHLNAEAYDQQYFGPAFAVLEDKSACETYGPTVQPILDQLVALGGSREPLPDQDAAYEDWRKMQDEWDAADAAPVGKTKTK